MACHFLLQNSSVENGNSCLLSDLSGKYLYYFPIKKDNNLKSDFTSVYVESQ